MSILGDIGHAAEDVGKVAADVAVAAATPTPGELRYQQFAAEHLGVYCQWCELSPAAQATWEAGGPDDGFDIPPMWFERAPVVVEHPDHVLYCSPPVMGRPPVVEHAPVAPHEPPKPTQHK